MNGKISFPGFEIAHLISQAERDVNDGCGSIGEIKKIITKLNEAIDRDPTSPVLIEQKRRVKTLVGRLQSQLIDDEVQEICSKTDQIAARALGGQESLKEAQHIMAQMEALSQMNALSMQNLKKLAEAKRQLADLGLNSGLFDKTPIESNLKLSDKESYSASEELMDMGNSLYSYRLKDFFDQFNHLPPDIKDLFLAHCEQRGASIHALQTSTISSDLHSNIHALLQSLMRCVTHVVQGVDLQEYLPIEAVEEIFSEGQAHEEHL